MEADEASMTSLSQQSEDDFERNKVTHMQIELGLSLFFNLFSSLEAISNAFPKAGIKASAAIDNQSYGHQV